MTTLPNMGLVLPTRGAPGSGHWADALDAQAALIDAHDHTSGKGVRVPVSGLNINANISFGSQWAITALARATFASIAPPAVNKSVWVADGTGGTSANELYWTSNAGTNVKITNAGALNVAAFVGGIGGDYTAVAAALNYDSSGTRYTLKGAAGTNWARMASGEVRIFETGTSETVFVGHAAPAALASSYTVTWPLALPANTAPLSISSTGIITTTDTLVHSLALAVGAAGTVQGATLQLATTTAQNFLPVTVPAGRTITGWTVYLQKTSAAGTVSATMNTSNGVTGVSTSIGSTATNSANNPGFVTLSQSGLSNAVLATNMYYITVTGGGTTGDNLWAYAVTLA